MFRAPYTIKQQLTSNTPTTRNIRGMPNGTLTPSPGAISMKTCIPCGIAPAVGIPDVGPVLRNCGKLLGGGNPNGIYKNKQSSTEHV